MTLCEYATAHVLAAAAFRGRVSVVRDFLRDGTWDATHAVAKLEEAAALLAEEEAAIQAQWDAERPQRSELAHV